MKTALVTGASRGIGRAIAVSLAKNGYNLGICSRSSEEKLLETGELCKSLGAKVKIYKGNLSEEAFVENMFRDVKETFGKLDLLVNNAGISKVGLLTDMTAEDWTEICGSNLTSVVLCSREAAKLMVHEKKGSIINISSMWGQVGASCETLYSATKGGIDAFTKALAKELAPSGIAVNALAPGVIDTEMNDHLSNDEKDELAEEIPAGRFGTTEEVAEAVVKLSEMSPYLTGQIIRMDGGMI